LVDAARKKIATALVEGCELRIEGGEYHFENKRFRCQRCYHLVEVSLDDADLDVCPACGASEVTNLNITFGLRGQCRRHGGDFHE
jgi:Zn finger protein HypA/HybF involved in hydrogenase expression